MTFPNFNRYALGLCAELAILAACGVAQSP